MPRRKKPNTMSAWKTHIDSLSRSQRSKRYPGMHKDLIPAYEMIKGLGLEGSAGTAPSITQNAQRIAAASLNHRTTQPSARKDLFAPTPAKPLLWQRSRDFAPSVSSLLDNFSSMRGQDPGAPSLFSPFAASQTEQSATNPLLSQQPYRSTFQPYLTQATPSAPFGIGLTTSDPNAFDAPPEMKAMQRATDRTLRQAHEEVLQTFRDFWAFYNAASEEEKHEVKRELLQLGVAVIPGVAEVQAAVNIYHDGEMDADDKMKAIALVILFLIPVLGNAKKAIRFWRGFKSIAKRGARKVGAQAAKVWTRDEIRTILKDAMLAAAEETAAQIVANGYSFKNWNSTDLGISTVSGVLSGHINQSGSPNLEAWGDIANAIGTAFVRDISKGNYDSALKSINKAALKSLIMGLLAIAAQRIFDRIGVNYRYRDDIMITLNVIISRVIDNWLARYG